MNFVIQENEKPVLPHCGFSVDGVLHEKLEQYEMMKCFNRHTVSAFLGKPGSGKTSTLYGFFKSKKLLWKVYDDVYVFQPRASRASMNDSIFDSLNENKKFDELNESTLTEVMSRIKGEETGNSCIIFDDMGSLLKNNELQQMLKELLQNRRHYRVSVFFLVQTFHSMPFEIRRLVVNWVIFEVSKSSFLKLFEELVETITDKNDIIKLKNMVYTKPHVYLLYAADSGRFFSNFDEIIIGD